MALCPISQVEFCPNCGTDVSKPQFLQQAAGWYIGTQCECGGYARWSAEYFPTEYFAREAWKSDEWTLRSN